ncbi:hypothetical protein BHM03_00042343 [Ensete ventricosum]|nr:hypothetical protein BHM03_00042343 [Ensete ventricosum]
MLSENQLGSFTLKTPVIQIMSQLNPKCLWASLINIRAEYYQKTQMELICRQRL